MKAWKQYTLLNIGAVIGVGISLFIVPENTPLRLWAIMSFISIALLNYGLYLRRHPTRKQARGTIIIWCGFVLLIADLLFSRFHTR
jgi:hypothetical protein